MSSFYQIKAASRLQTVSFESTNGHFLCCDKDKDHKMVCDRKKIGSWERFHLIILDEKHVAIQSIFGRYVSASDGGGGSIMANRNQIKSWEKFEVIFVSDQYLSLRASNGMYLSALDGGGGKVKAVGSQIGKWEIFGIKTQRIKQFALVSDYGQYISAVDGGGGRVLANKNNFKQWEKFDIYWQDNKHISLRTEKGKYLRTLVGGSGKVRATGVGLGLTEMFKIKTLPNGKFAFQAYDKQHYLSASHNDEKEVSVKKPLGPWEKMKVLTFGKYGSFIIGHRQIGELINDSTSTIFVKPEEAKSAIPIKPGKKYKGNFDGLKVNGQVIKVVDNCDYVKVTDEKIKIQCDNFALKKAGDILDINAETLEVKLSARVNAFFQELFGGILEERPKDDNWTKLYEAETATEKKVKIEVKSKPSKSENSPRRRPRESFRSQGRRGDIEIFKDPSWGPNAFG